MAAIWEPSKHVEGCEMLRKSFHQTANSVMFHVRLGERSIALFSGRGWKLWLCEAEAERLFAPLCLSYYVCAGVCASVTFPSCCLKPMVDASLQTVTCCCWLQPQITLSHTLSHTLSVCVCVCVFFFISSVLSCFSCSLCPFLSNCLCWLIDS